MRAYSEVGLLTKSKNVRDLRDWVMHYNSIGVEKITIFNNESLFDVEDAIKDLNRGHISIQEVKGWPNALHIFNSYSQISTSKWLAFFDDDEFLHIGKHSNVNSFLENYESYPGVAINWKMMGSNPAVDYRTNISLIDENLQTFSNADLRILSAPWNGPFGCNSHVRSFTMPEFVHSYPTPHLPIFHSGMTAVDIDFNFRRAPVGERYCDDVVICHYWTKTRADYEFKISRGRNDIQGMPYNYGNFDEITSWFKVTDRRMADWKKENWK